MKVLNFGSLNYDYTYSVPHIVAPGETITSTGLELFPGGKGLNQSIALARAGTSVYHAGSLGPDGAMLRQICAENNVDHRLIRQVEERTGNAIIQVGADGQNSMVLFAGANRKNDRAHVDGVLAEFEAGDWILLQNEISEMDYLIDSAHEKGMIIALNPSPMDDGLLRCSLDKVSLFLLNEVEGAQITGASRPEEILAGLRRRFPGARAVLTLGASGALYQDGEKICRQAAYPVSSVDTTAAGDTFTGFFLTGMVEGLPVEQSLRLAAAAAALAVSRRGAVSSIPTRAEAERMIAEIDKGPVQD